MQVGYNKIGYNDESYNFSPEFNLFLGDIVTSTDTLIKTPQKFMIDFMFSTDNLSKTLSNRILTDLITLGSWLEQHKRPAQNIWHS